LSREQQLPVHFQPPEAKSESSYLKMRIRRSHDLTSPDFDVFCTEYDVKWRMKNVAMTVGGTEQSPFFGTPKSLY